MNSYDLSGQVALVTGGAQGIGFAVAQSLSAAGAKVAIADLDATLAQDSARALGQGARAYGVDVTDCAAVAHMADMIAQDMGLVSVLVTSAGIAGSNCRLVDYNPTEWAQIIEVNLNGTFHTARAILPQMQAQSYGRVVTIASVAGKEGNPNAAAYSASKAGVIALTKSLGKEYAQSDYMLSKIPRGRFLELPEAAHMITWLCTKENGFSTGAVFDLSGGRATY
jgi:2-dehydro-3-deoxy-L-rhamnonate dehydrogenase (NAD+)